MKRRTKSASFVKEGYTYECTLTETRGAVAPYKLDIINGSDELHLDSDFKCWSDDIWSDFDELVNTDKFQQDVINSNWWEYDA